MDVTEQIKRYHDFIEKQYLDALYETVRKGENRLVVSFLKLIEFDPELANELLERPEECISAAEFAVKEFDLPAEIKNFRVRFNELSESQKMMIRNIRSKHLSKLFHIEGIVRQKSDVRPQVTSAKFECPSCGNIISVLQLEATFKEPSRCGCGRKGKFRLLSKELIDAQRLVLEEAPEDLDGGEQPKRIGVFLKDDLVSPMSDKKTNPGNKVMVTGIVKEVAKTGRDGSKLITFDLNIEANYIEPSQEDYYQMEITEEDEEKIKKIAYDPRVYTLISESIAPTIFGYDRVKEAIALQLVGGVKKSRKDGTVTRGDMHVLLIGDPGSGKCVVGNTKIILDNGEITTIQEFYDNNTRNADLLNMQRVFSIDVDGLNFTSNAVRLWRRNAPEHLLKIVTSTGNELIVTDEHPLFTTKNGLIFGKNAIDFKSGEYIALPSKIEVNGSIQKIPLEIKHTPAYNKARYEIKNIFDEEFARLLGYLVGDGYVRMRKTTGVISFTNKSQEILADFERLVEKCFHRKVSKRRKQNSECYEYYTCSIELVRILQNMDECITKKSGEMKICKIAALSPNNILREFIRALFECEGSISKSKREIEFSSKSKDLIFDLKYLLLRFGIISQVSPCIKYAANTENKTRRTYYRLRISGEQSIRFVDNIGFISAEKTDKLLAWKRDDKKLNTNINIIPSIGNLLKTLRNTYGLSQSSFSIRRSTYQHYERGDRYPSHDKLRKIAARYNEINKDDPLVQILDKIANTDLFWDKIKSVETIKSEEDYVYDIEIETVHNFIANGVMVHNSQLLKRTSKIAPKARYVSGKGVSGAGLCVSPNSFILTNPGGIETIKQVVEDRLTSPYEVIENAWKQENITDVKIQSLSHDLIIHSKHPDAIWKLKAPETMFEVRLSSGKKIELTGNTKLLTIAEGKLTWKKCMELTNEYIATPRKLIQGIVEKQYAVDLIKSNPVVHNIKPFVKELTKRLSEKYGTIRIAARKLDMNENNLYHNWVLDSARGNIKLNTLKKICDDVQVDWKEKIREISLYNGKNHSLPVYLNEDFFYMAGLITGDGDIRLNNDTISVRLSNSDSVLHEIFKNVLHKQFNLSFDIQKGNSKRPTATRTNSKILGEILLALGIPFSPKSQRIKLSEVLLHLSNKFLSHYIAGLIDTDGSVVIRKTRGSDNIEYTTCSEMLARQLQLVLLRFGIHSKLRKRPPSTGKIKGNYDKWILVIRGIDQIRLFASQIKLRHPRKKEKLERIIKKNMIPNTNVDIILGLGKKLREICKNNKIQLKIRLKDNLSRNKLQNILLQLEDCHFTNISELAEIKKIAFSDIFWEKIVSIAQKKPDYGYVYDLTVADSHNFVVDGVLVHNTASVVKDEFLGGWSLEAGALPLANKGFCVAGDTEVYLANGNLKRIDEIYNDFNNKTKLEVYYLNPDTYKFEKAKIINVSKRTVDTTFKIETDTGQIIVATEEHPFAIWDNGLGWKEVKHLKEKDSLFVPRHFPISVNDEKNDNLYYFLGLIATDGHLSKKKYTVSFYTASEQLKDDFERLSVKLFGKKPGCSIDKRKSHYHLFICSKKIHQMIEGYGIPKGNKSIDPIIPDQLINCKINEIKSFLIGAINGDGSISNRKSGGIIDIVCGNEANAYFYQKLFRKIGIISRVSKIHSKGGGVVKPGNYVVYKTSITGISDMKQLYDERLLSYKKESLVKIISREDRSWRIPNLSLLLKKLHDAIPWFEKNMMYSNSIRLSRINEKTEISRFALFNCIKDLEICNPANKTVEYNELKKIIDNKIIFPRIERITKLSSKREVYNIQLDKREAPNFIANFLLVHNCLIDEMDKMSEEDTAAMHEALEGQSYHPNTEIILANGDKTTIGDFVDSHMTEGKIIKGHNCEFSFPKNVSILTTDFNRIYQQKISRISRHPAPDTFYKITFSNGRNITVTPEHPLFVYRNGQISEIAAMHVKQGLKVPAPKILRIDEQEISLIPNTKKYHHHKPCMFPTKINWDLCRLIGYIITEGHSYANQSTRVFEIGISNTERMIIKDAQKLFNTIFGTSTIITKQPVNKREKATLPLYTLRCLSRPIYDFFSANFPELLKKAPQKRIPKQFIKTSDNNIYEFLQSAFLGDGTVEKSDYGYCTASRKLSEDYQDLLLRIGIPSIIRTHQKYYKTIITGTIEEKQKFFNHVISQNDKRHNKVKQLLDRAQNKLNQRNPALPEHAKIIHNSLIDLHMADGYITGILSRNYTPSKEKLARYTAQIQNRLTKINSAANIRQLRRDANIKAQLLAKKLNCSTRSLYNYENENHMNHAAYITVLNQETFSKIQNIAEAIAPVTKFLESDIRILEIVNVEKIMNQGVKMVYDITVLPHQSFVSQGLILHNTITISKANIQATLRAETTVLAAANPKLGRFDPYDILAKQIAMPPALINRFDLIFAFKDLPNTEKDERMASHILKLHQSPDVAEPEITTEILRKFISYARQNCHPVLSSEAIEELKTYYVQMRNSTNSEEAGMKAVPISARQLEALVRLAEATAKLRLGTEVTREDAKRAVDILHFSLSEIGIDPETGKIDIDRIASGITASQRTKIHKIKDIILELENKFGKNVPIQDIIEEAKLQGLTEDQVEEALEKLKRSGDLFEPTKGYVASI